jgi:hypothetical protein
MYVREIQGAICKYFFHSRNFLNKAKNSDAEDGIIPSHRRENLKYYIALNGWDLLPRSNVSPVKYEQGSYIPEDDILHSHCRENLKSYIALTGWTL